MRVKGELWFEDTQTDIKTDPYKDRQRTLGDKEDYNHHQCFYGLNDKWDFKPRRQPLHLTQQGWEAPPDALGRNLDEERYLIFWRLQNQWLPVTDGWGPGPGARRLGHSLQTPEGQVTDYSAPPDAAWSGELSNAQGRALTTDKRTRGRRSRSGWRQKGVSGLLARSQTALSWGFILMSAWGVFTEPFSANVHAQTVLSATEQTLVWEVSALFLLESLWFRQCVYLEKYKINFSGSCASAPDCSGCAGAEEAGSETQTLVLSLSLFLSRSSYVSI